MKLSEAAEILDVPKQKLWRAVKAGKLDAVKKKQGSKRAEYDVTEEALQSYQQEYLEPESETVTSDDTSEAIRDDARRYGDTTGVTHEDSQGIIYSLMLDRLTRAERRSIELELLLRQQQNLLTENAESVQEKIAEKMQAEVKAKKAEEQSKILALEVESLKTQMMAQEAQWNEMRKPWWRKIFSKQTG